MLRSASRALNVPALLLSGALLLSFGLNVLLLRATDGPADDGELAAANAELHLTQRLLSECQHAQLQQQDSLLLQLRARNSGVLPASSQSVSSSPIP